MKKTLMLLILFVVMILVGCSPNYNHQKLQSVDQKLDSSEGVLISIPENGWYENTEYRNSGKMTANAVRAAFSKYTSRVDVTNKCHGDDCFGIIDFEKYGYYVKPEILHWEERATEWSGIPDQIEIQLAVYDVITKEELANYSYTGKSKWLTFGGDHPQDLLPEPTNRNVRKLYQ